MSSKQIDARGLACPQPVLLTSQALETNDEVVTLVDNVAATENLRRFGTKRACAVQVEEGADGFRVVLRRADATPAVAPAAVPASATPGTATVLLVASDRIGQGSDELGLVLARSFFHTLGEMKEPPTTLIFMNAGVRLTLDDSPVLEDLKLLAEKGATVLACGTCLNYFEVASRLAVGRISNMYEIAETLLEAQRTVRL